MHNMSCDTVGLSSGNTIIKKARNSSFEFLRIIAMYSITICHLATHGNFGFDSKVLSVPRFWWYFIELGGNFGVNVFVLISGYFLILDDSGVFNLKKVLKIWGQVFFYSVLIYIVFGLLGVSEFSFPGLVKTIFPIISEGWWFASTYFVLFLLHPFLNMFLNHIDKKTFQSLLVLLIIIWCIIPSFSFSEYQSNNLLWFITLYAIAAYIRLFNLNPVFKLKHYVFLCILFSVLRYLSGIILIIIGTKIAFATAHSLAFYRMQSVLTLLSALSMFMVFKNINMSYKRWINVIASASFGVYLIHDHRVVREFLWIKLFNVALYQNSLLLIPYSLGVVFFIYLTCTIIDILRQAVFEKVFLNAVEKEAVHITKPVEAAITICKKALFGN